MLKGVHVVVGTPDYLARVAVGGNLRLQHVRSVVIDEADACLTDTEQARAMQQLLAQMASARAALGAQAPPPQTLLAGASLSPALVRRAVDDGWVRAPAYVSEAGWTDVELEAVERTLITEQRVPSGATHEYVVTETRDAIAVLCRLLRERFEAVNSDTEPPRAHRTAQPRRRPRPRLEPRPRPRPRPRRLPSCLAAGHSHGALPLATLVQPLGSRARARSAPHHAPHHAQASSSSRRRLTRRSRWLPSCRVPCLGR